MHSFIICMPPIGNLRMYYCFANSLTHSCWKMQGDRKIQFSPVNWHKILNNYFWTKMRMGENQRLETVTIGISP